MTDRADDLCDFAKAVIEAAAQASPPADGTAVVVTCDDIPDIDPAALPADTLYALIWWESYADGGPMARGVDATDYRVCVLCVQRYGAAGEPTTAWRRARSGWVRRCVVDALGDAREKLDGAYALSLDDVTFDQEELMERKLFWTKVSITLRDEREV